MYEPVNLGTNISARKSTKQDYSGPKDEETELNEGIGSIIYDFDNYIQSYEGTFIWNNMHGYGEYKWELLRSKYEGQFYANKKEGYGRFSYPSGAYFEVVIQPFGFMSITSNWLGLYRNDRRFGPGIFTDAAGYQDVGIWVASKLIRLSRSFEPDDAMPRLAVTNEDKIRILQYREIVHLQKDKEKHVAENVLESLTQSRNYDKSVMARAEELYNPFCKDARAASFNKPRYDKAFFVNESDDQFTIDVILTEEKEIQQKISDEKQVLIQVESLTMKDDVPRIHESKTTRDDMHDLENIRMDQEKLIEDKLNSETKIAPFENEGEKEEEEESDYCGIKPTNFEKLNDSILKGNHENLWSIFQRSNIAILRDLPETSDASLSHGDNIEKSDSDKKVSSGDEFDDFGRKKINGTKPWTKKVLVTGLLAWNNSSLLIELLKHVFKHRNFEKTLSFDISKILAGRRGSFEQEGAHEKAALDLLEACSDGFQSKISKLILRQNVDPDVADSRGNTGLLLAAVGDKLEAIETLLNLGANIDIINDECLTPLSLCILRLLESIHSVTDWSKAFLPNEINGESIVENKMMNFENYKQWHGRISYESLSQKMPKQMEQNHLLVKNESTELGSDNVSIKKESEIAKDTVNIGSVAGMKHVLESNAQLDKRKGMKKPGQNWARQKNYDRSYDQKYIFDMRPTITKASIPQLKMKNKPTKNKNNKIEVEISRDSKTKQENVLRESKQIQQDYPKIKKIRDTISKLLTRGADPNFAQVPFPVLIMAIFTKIPSLLSELLDYGADPNTTLPKADHSLTPLLILTILQPAYENSLMAKALLKAKANPSLRADPSYRKDLMERLSCDRAPKYLDYSEGVTPLHILAIRVDIDTDVDEHLTALIKVFYKEGSIRRSDLYQGHSPLSLVIVEANLIGAKRLLKTKFINVNEQLGADLGSAMLMLESCALQKLLPSDLLQKFLELLLEYGGCPFSSANALGEEYNQIEYGRKELTKVLTMAESFVEAKEKKGKKETKKSSKSSKETVMKNFTRSMDFVQKIAREKLIGWIRASFVKELLNSPVMLLPAAKQLSVFFKEPLFNYALNWMTEEDLATVMKTMNCSRDNVAKLVRLFVAARVLTQQKKSSNLNTLVQNETEKIIDKVMPLVDEKQQILASANFKVEKTIGEKERKNLEPELDLENKKFKVCFECFGVHRKILIACPKCKRLYFCSEECNFKNTEREANPHQCPIFYQKEWTWAEKIASSSGINAISYMLEKFENPEKYIDLEEKVRRSEKQGVKKCEMEGSSKYREENMCNAKAKYRDDELAVYEKLRGSNYKINRVNGGNQPADKRKYDYEREENSANRSEAKERNTKTVHQENRMYINNVKENNEDNDDDDDNDDKIRSKNTSTKGHRSENKNEITKDVSDEKKSLQKAKKSDEKKEKKPTNERSVKVKNEKKNRYRVTNDEEVIKDETGTESKGDKNKKKQNVIVDDEVARTSSDGVKSKKGKKKSRRFDENEFNEKNSKFRVEKKKLINKTAVQRPNEFRRDKNVIANNAADKKREGSYNKREWDNRRNKRTREQDPNTWKNKAAIDKNETENNRVQGKYLNWLLKVNKSLGERFDIDMLLLPYVVFAQGDTYFRMLPAYRFPKYKGNYSLI